MDSPSAKFNFVPLSDTEAKEFTKELDALLLKYGAEMAIMPVINPNGTLGAWAQVGKKKMLDVPSPYNEPETGPETSTS